jgi:lipid A 3-O-deacylase
LRVLVFAGCGSLALGAGGAWASDVRARTPSASPTFVSEFRLGGLAHDPWGPERGSANLSGEILLQRPFTPADLFTSYFVPRPHFGGSFAFGGKTSFAYTGLTWTFHLAPRLFVEGSLGGALHNGSTSEMFVPIGRAALGCTPLFRESGSVGVKLSANWSLMATVEHLSNYGLCTENRGLTNVGARLGYTF